jgi:hypothetical protein
MDWSQEEAGRAVQQVMARAATDMEFRRRVLADPAAAVKEVAGKDLPAGFTVKVIENEPGVDQTFVLPDFQAEDLTDADLEAVAGGGCGKHGCTVRVG